MERDTVMGEKNAAKKYMDYMLDQTVKILDIDSPTGYTKDAVEYLCQEYKKLGYEPIVTTKGGVLVDLGGEDAQDGILLEAHLDTLEIGRAHV